METNQRLKKIELLGSLGAGVLGAGIALYFEEWLQAFALPALLIGALAHGWAMWEKHRLETQEQLIQPRWISFTYWLCWVLLTALFIYIGLHGFFS
jgi:hypothetical protein